MDINARGMLAATSPNLHVRGRLRLPSASAAGEADQIKLTVEQLPLEYIMPVVAPGEPRLQGRLSVELEGRLETLEPTQLTHSVSGTGHLELAEPVIRNLNVLRAVFQRLSMIPGLVQKLEQGLPPEYQAKLAAKDTVLSPLEVSLQLEDGWLRFDDLHVRSETFQLNGAGRVGFDGTVEIRCKLRIDPTLSAAMIRSVHELRGLANAQGEMEFPVAVQGRAQRVSVVPDLNYIASRVVVSTAVEALGRLLKKQQDGEIEGSEPEGVVEGLLQRVLGQ